MKEVWKDITGYEGLYQVSNLGRVKSLERTKDNNGGKVKVNERIMKISSDQAGYNIICLTKNGKRKTHKIHRLVALNFVPNPENKREVNHKDGNKSNNIYCNLEWSTRAENIRHAFATGLNGGEHLKNNSLSKKVIQYDKSMNLIAVYQSMSEAERKTGIHQENICQYCQNKRPTAGGYIWKYA